MPASRWISAVMARADIRAEARGPSGTLIASMPKRWSLRAFSISLAGDTPLGETSSTRVTNWPRASLLASLDLSFFSTTLTVSGALTLRLIPSVSIRFEGWRA